MNKKGFTMVELIAVIVIIGVILVFALPNVTSTIERNKKDRMINDAKDMVDKAKNYILSGKESYPTAGCKSFELSDIDLREEIKESPYGKSYDRDNSEVQICLESKEYKYTVTLIDEGGNKIDGEPIADLNSSNKYNLVKTN